MTLLAVLWLREGRPYIDIKNSKKNNNRLLRRKDRAITNTTVKNKSMSSSSRNWPQVRDDKCLKEALYGRERQQLGDSEVTTTAPPPDQGIYSFSNPTIYFVTVFETFHFLHRCLTMNGNKGKGIKDGVNRTFWDTLRILFLRKV